MTLSTAGQENLELASGATKQQEGASIPGLPIVDPHH